MKLSLEIHKKNVRHSQYINLSSTIDKNRDLLFIGYEECSHGYEINRKSFPFWTLEIIIEGNASLRYAQKRYSLQAGSVFCYGPNTAHSFANTEQSLLKKFFLISGQQEFPQNWQNKKLRALRPDHLSDWYRCTDILRQILQENERMDAHSEAIIELLVKRCTHQLKKALSSQIQQVSLAEKAYQIALKLIEEDYAHLQSLEQISQKSGYSKEYLCRVFKRYRKQSPYNALTQKKMQAAWDLLSQQKMKVSAAAFSVGYEDQLHFSKVFKKTMGCSPSSIKTL
tara:strand:- start:276 stop:1124 length:849 start_codon:yes stop_codon:yes gene_type:complete